MGGGAYYITFFFKKSYIAVFSPYSSRCCHSGMPRPVKKGLPESSHEEGWLWVV